MNKVTISAVYLAAGLSVVTVSLPVKAETPSTSGHSASAGAAPPAQNLANWWMNSSLFYDPMPSRVLKHFEGTVGYSSSSGNIDGSMLDVKANLDLRKRRFTNRAIGDYMMRDTRYGNRGGTVKTTQSTLSNRLDFDLTKDFVLVGGAENYHDTILEIDHRTSLFGGFGAYKKLNERNVMNITGGLAYSWFRFDQTRLLPAVARSGETLDTTVPSSGAVLVMQTWRAQVTKKASLTQQGTFIDYFNPDLGRRWSAGVDLNVPIANHISIALGYQLKSEINRYTGILGVRPQDRVLTTGIRLVL